MKYDMAKAFGLAEKVTPLVGVWIEIMTLLNRHMPKLSLPLWECGLKYRATKTYDDSVIVTPLVGVWIEIIDDVVYNDTDSMSLPLWECGLKYQVYFRLSYTYGHSPCGSVD